MKYMLIYMSWILSLKLISQSFLQQEDVELLYSVVAIKAAR